MNECNKVGLNGRPLDIKIRGKERNQEVTDWSAFILKVLALNYQITLMKVEDRS